jgi:hypothetical protein
VAKPCRKDYLSRPRAFSDVALGACGNKVFNGVSAAARDGNYMIDVQLHVRRFPAAIDARKVAPAQNIKLGFWL